MHTLEQLKIKLWKNIYKQLLDNYLKVSDGLTLESPHIIIKEIILEIDGNGLNNSHNVKYFTKKLDYFKEQDIIIKNNFSADFNLIKLGIFEKRIGYVLVLCRSIEQKFNDGFYFKELLKVISEIIVGPQEISHDLYLNLKSISEKLITEFILKNYALSDYKNFIENIFSDYEIREYGIHSDFPIQLFGYKLSNSNASDEIPNFIRNLTTSIRIEALNKYFEIIPSKVKFLFVVLGLKGMDKLEYGDITFYNPLIDNLTDLKKGILQADAEGNFQDHVFLEAAVEVNLTLPSSALSEALTKLEKALDLIQAFVKIDIPLTVDLTKYCMIDQNGEIIYLAYGSTNPNRTELYFESLELDQYIPLLDKIFKSNELEPSIFNINNSDITNALHWYRKGNDSSRDADKLLNFWISIENIFSSFGELSKDILGVKENGQLLNVVQSTMDSISFLNVLHNEAWVLYWHYRNRVYYEGVNFLPQTVIDKAKLDPKGQYEIDLKDFIEDLKEIINFEIDPIYQAKVNHVLKLFSDKQIQKKHIESISERVRDEILMIYRLRNMIVHNAKYNNPLLPYYVWMARSFAGTLIRSVIEELKKGKSINDSLIGFRVFKDQYVSKLK